MKPSRTARRFFLISEKPEETSYLKKRLAVPSEKISKKN